MYGAKTFIFRAWLLQIDLSSIVIQLFSENFNLIEQFLEMERISRLVHYVSLFFFFFSLFVWCIFIWLNGHYSQISIDCVLSLFSRFKINAIGKAKQSKANNLLNSIWFRNKRQTKLRQTKQNKIQFIWIISIVKRMEKFNKYWLN